MNCNCRSFWIGSAIALLTAGAACVGPPPSSTAEMGNVEANLKLSATTSLNTASYAITGPNMFARSGTVDVSQSQTISFTVGGIPAGTGYNATISGTATDGVTTCSGSGTFSITAGTPR